jgi:hypothetical protein
MEMSQMFLERRLTQLNVFKRMNLSAGAAAHHGELLLGRFPEVVELLGHGAV